VQSYEFGAFGPAGDRLGVFAHGDGAPNSVLHRRCLVHRGCPVALVRSAVVRRSTVSLLALYA